MDTVFKTYRAEVKEVNSDEGTIDMVIPISSGQVDRDGEVIEPMAFKKTIPKFMKHPVLVASHDYRDLTNQIGEWTKLKVEEDGVNGKPKYYINAGNEQADWAYYLASKGVAAFSVGFIPKVWEDGESEKSPRRTYKEVELLEISQVIIPSNREAVQTMRSKSVDPVITELCDAVDKELENEETKEIVLKPEETESFYRIPVPGEEGKHDGHKIRTIDVSKEKGIKGLYCTEEKKIITYMFDKQKWDSMKECQEWVKEHMGKSFDTEDDIEVEDEPKSKVASQQELLDEIDYIKSLIDEVGMNEDVIDSLKSLLEIEEKQGAVLNKRNKDKLNQIKALAQQVLDSAGQEEEEEKRNLGDDTPINEKNDTDDFSMDDILEAIHSMKL